MLNTFASKVASQYAQCELIYSSRLYSRATDLLQIIAINQWKQIWKNRKYVGEITNLNLARQVIWELGGAGYFLSLIRLFISVTGQRQAKYFCFFHQGYFQNYNLLQMANFAQIQFLLPTFVMFFFFHYWHTLYPLGYHINHPGNSEIASYNANVISHCVRLSAPRPERGGKKKKKVPLVLCVSGNLTWLSSLMCVSICLL